MSDTYLTAYYDGVNYANKRNDAVNKVKNADIRRLRALNAALQQSLDEANARIDALTAKPALPFEVGDTVRSTNNMSPHVVYTVVRINAAAFTVDVKSRSGHTYYGHSIDLFYKVS